MVQYRALKGKRVMLSVLITRPREQAESLAQKLLQLNIAPLVFPTIEIKSVNFKAEINLNKYNILIFVSPAAIIHFAAHIKKIPSQLKIFTMGEDSAKMIEELGWPKALYPHNHFSREHLLQLPELQQLSHQAVLIIEGKNGSPELHTHLESRGAKVSHLITYERTLPQPKKLPELDTIDITICTSQEGLKNLVTLLGPDIKTKPLLLSSQKLASLAKTLGFTGRIFLAENAGDNALIQALPS